MPAISVIWLTDAAKYDIFTQVKCVDREFCAESHFREHTSGGSVYDLVQLSPLNRLLECSRAVRERPLQR